MTKKITLIMLVLLIVSAFVFVSCDQEDAGGAGGGGGKPGPAPKPKEPVVNDLGEIKTIIDYKFDEEAPYKQLTGDGATISYAEGKGMEGSDAILVETNYIYGQVAIDMTKFYARGKSYYIEVWFKDAGIEGARTDDLNAKIDFSLITGAGYNYYPDHQTWDIPGQYVGGMLSNDDAALIFEYETNLMATGVPITSDGWTKVCGILDAEDIEYVITTMDDLCHEKGESTLYEFNIIFLVGTYPEGYEGDEAAHGIGQNDYKYYLDNIKIVDLNDDIDVEGQTYEIPEEDEGDAGEGGGEGAGA